MSSRFEYRPLVLALLALHSAPSLAQEAATAPETAAPAAPEAPAAAAPVVRPVDSAVELQTVTVKAQAESAYKADTVSSPKFTQPLVDTPQTISVIKKELIEQQGGTTLTEALRNTPGVSTFFLGENGSTSTGDAVYMRGFDSSNSIYVDGVRDLGSISRDTFNTEQVEVVKGPAGTDNGRSSPTGAINMVSKQAQLGNSSSGSLMLSTEDQKRLTADVNQQLSDTSALRLNVMGQQSDQPGRDVAESNRWGVAPSIVFGLGTPLRTTLNYLHVQQNNIPDGGVPTIGLPGYSNPDPNLNNGAPVNPSNFYGTVNDFDDVTADMVTLKFESDLSEHTTLRNTTRWGRTKQDYSLVAFMTLVAPPATATDPSTWTLARSNITNKIQQNEITTNQTNVTSELATGSVKHSLTGGVELSSEQQTTQGVTGTGSYPVANLYNPNPNVGGYVRTPNATGSDGQTNTIAAYLFDTVHFTENFFATAGVRVDHYETDYDASAICTTTTPLPRGGTACPTGVADGTVISTTDMSTSGTLLNWKLGAAYKPTADSSIYVDYALSQQPPGGSNFQLASTANSANNPNFDPQKAKTIELGTKWDVLESQLAVTAAIYRTDITNEIESDGGSPAQYYQTGKKRVQGVELGLVGNITEAWAVSAGFTTMDTKVVSGALVGNTSSDALNYTPKEAFTSWTTYKLPFGLTIGGGARYNGKLQRGKDGAVGTPAFTEAYWVFDGMAAYSLTRNVDLQLNVYNLADKDYVAAINKSGYRYTPGTPRYASLTANVKF